MKNESMRQIVIRRIAIVILIILLILTFFSNTIMHYSLPQVSVIKITSGKLSDAAVYSGTLLPLSAAVISASGACSVISLDVYTGQKVEAGERLGVVEYVEEEQLEQLYIARKEAEYNYERAVLECPEYSYFIQELEISQAQHALDVANVQLVHADQTLKSQAEEQVISCTYALEKLLYELENQKNQDQKEAALANLYVEYLKDQVDEFDKKIEKIESHMGKEEIISPVNGIVTNISAYAGDTLLDGETWLEVYIPDEDYELCVSVPAKQALKLYEGYEPKNVSGVYRADAVLERIMDIEYETEYKRLSFRVSFTDEIPQSGVRASVTIETESQMYDNVVPLCALHEDVDGTFVYIISIENSVLGSRYYAEKIYVSCIYKNDSYAALVDYLDGYVVMDSNKPITNHMQVRTY